MLRASQCSCGKFHSGCWFTDFQEFAADDAGGELCLPDARAPCQHELQGVQPLARGRVRAGWSASSVWHDELVCCYCLCLWRVVGPQLACCTLKTMIVVVVLFFLWELRELSCDGNSKGIRYCRYLCFCCRSDHSSTPPPVGKCGKEGSTVITAHVW